MIKRMTITLATLLLVACGGGEPGSEAATGPAAKTFKWKMVTSWPKNYPGLGTAPERFAENVERMSGGRLTVRVYGAGELVPALEVFDAVSQGTVEMGHSGAYYWKGKIPAAPFFATVPFGLNAREINAWMHHGGGLEMWREAYAPFNLIPFPMGNSGVQMAGWFNREINTLDDLKGLKMRIPGLGGEVIHRAGGQSINIPGGELYTSMQTNVIDATEWVSPYNDMAFGFYQVAKYYYYPGWHEPGAVLELMVNKQAFESLPADLQAIVEVAARAANQDMLDEYTAQNAISLQELIDKHGVEVKPLPDEVLSGLKEISGQVLNELAASDPLAAKVWASQKAFMERTMSYEAITDEAYSKARRK
ncbi:MAG: ABC transporter substrate-binding protein [Porticoccaceae bacterium]|nr:ABC transporter substrate-binding protein [Porticoccaceae bacterium]